MLIFNIPGSQLQSQDSAFNAKSSKSVGCGSQTFIPNFFHNSEERGFY